MKYFIYIPFLLSLFSCSTEEPVITTPSNKIVFKTLASDDGEASNAANPYDNYGKSYLYLYDAYERLKPKPVDNINIIASIENIAIGLNLLGDEYNPRAYQNIEDIKQLATNNTILAIQGLNIHPNAKTDLTTIINLLVSLKAGNAPYDTVYSDLLQKEAAVLLSDLPQKDKEVVLTTLAIVRHDIYNKSRKKRKDRDWEISVGNFLMIAYGAEVSFSNAVINGAAAEFID